MTTQALSLRRSSRKCKQKTVYMDESEHDSETETSDKTSETTGSRGSVEPKRFKRNIDKNSNLTGAKRNKKQTALTGSLEDLEDSDFEPEGSSNKSSAPASLYDDSEDSDYAPSFESKSKSKPARKSAARGKKRTDQEYYEEVDEEEELPKTLKQEPRVIISEDDLLAEFAHLGATPTSLRPPPTTSTATAPVSTAATPVSTATAPVSTATAPVSDATAPVKANEDKNRNLFDCFSSSQPLSQPESDLVTKPIKREQGINESAVTEKKNPQLSSDDLPKAAVPRAVVVSEDDLLVPRSVILSDDDLRVEPPNLELLSPQSMEYQDGTVDEGCPLDQDQDPEQSDSEEAIKHDVKSVDSVKSECVDEETTETGKTKKGRKVAAPQQARKVTNRRTRGAKQETEDNEEFEDQSRDSQSSSVASNRRTSRGKQTKKRKKEEKELEEENGRRVSRSRKARRVSYKELSDSEELNTSGVSQGNENNNSKRDRGEPGRRTTRSRASKIEEAESDTEVKTVKTQGANQRSRRSLRATAAANEDKESSSTVISEEGADVKGGIQSMRLIDEGAEENEDEVTGKEKKTEEPKEGIKEEEDEVMDSGGEPSDGDEQGNQSTQKNESPQKDYSKDRKRKQDGGGDEADGENKKSRQDKSIPADVMRLLKNPPVPVMERYIGAHTSVANGLHNAVFDMVRMKGLAMGLFLRNQRQWKANPMTDHQIEAFKHAVKVCKVPVDKILPHASYLLNCGSPDPTKLQKSRELLIDELQRCEALGLLLYNIHPGSTCGEISREECIDRIAATINLALAATNTVTVVLENMSCQGNTIGGDFAELKAIINKIERKDRIGVCLDTCHALAAGFDVSTDHGFKDMMNKFEETVGVQYLKAFHINDSKAKRGSHLDRHENIGRGYIGLRGFTVMVNDPRLKNMPLILETPLDIPDADEITILYDLLKKP